RTPGGGIAQLGRTGHAGCVTGGTGRREDLFTGAFLTGGVGGDQRETGNRLNAFGHGFLRLGVGTDTERRARNHQPDQQGNDDDWYHKGQHDESDELLWSLDEAFVLSRLFDALFLSLHIEYEFMLEVQWPV